MTIEDMNHDERTIEEIPGELNTEQEADMHSADLRLCNARNGIKHELENQARRNWDAMTEAEQNHWAERCVKGTPYGVAAADFCEAVLS